MKKGFKRLGSVILTLTMLLQIISTISAAADGLTVTCVSPHFVFEGNDAVTFTVAGGTAASASVRDFFGNSYNANNDGSTITVSNLPYGYFELTVDGQVVPFAVVPKLEERRASEDSPFAITTMFTNASKVNTRVKADQTATDELTESFMKALKLTGVNDVRDMLNLNPLLDDNLDFNADKMSDNEDFYQFETLMKNYKSNNFDVQLTFQKWPMGNETLPSDLRLAYDIAKEISQFKNDNTKGWSCVNNYEIDNEQNYHNTKADKYAAYVKACALAINKFDPSADISVGGFGSMESKRSFIEKFYLNDIGDYIDGLNFHMYTQTTKNDSLKWYNIEDTAKTVHYAAAEKYGFDNKKLWLNETNLKTQYTMDATTGTINHQNVSLATLTPDQKTAMAKYMPAAYVEQLSNGMDKVFMFCFGYIYESGYGFGAFDYENHPTPLYSSVAGITQAIGNGKYYAQLDDIDCNAHIFKDGNEQIAAIWSETADSPITLDVNAASAKLIDMFGNESNLPINNGQVTLTASQNIQYVRIAGSFTGNVTVGSTYEKKYESRNIKQEDNIVLNQVFPESIENNTTSNTTYVLGGNTQMTLQVYNFGDNAAECTINATGNDYWSFGDTATQTVTVPANDMETLTFNLTSTNVPNVYESPIAFSGTVGGKPISKSVSYVAKSDTINETKIPTLTTSIDGVKYRNPYIEVSASDTNVNVRSIKAIINGEALDGIYENGVKSFKYSNKNDADVIELSYVDTFGQQHTQNINVHKIEVIEPINVDKNNVNINYEVPDSPKHNMTIIAYDVTGISGATAETPYQGELLTPIKYMNEDYSSGSCAFKLQQNYTGKLVVFVNNGADECISFLVEIAPDRDGNNKCKIVSVNVNSSLNVYSWENNLEGIIIFAKFGSNKELKGVRIIPKTFNKGSENINFPDGFTIGENESLKIYIWDNVISLIPLARNYE